MTNQQETIEAAIARKEAYSWVPACGGTEVAFKKNGRTMLYMWNTYTRAHAYYDLLSDFFLTPDEEVIMGFR